jgi:hypothetical protein
MLLPDYRCHQSHPRVTAQRRWSTSRADTSPRQQRSPEQPSRCAPGRRSAVDERGGNIALICSVNPGAVWCRTPHCLTDHQTPGVRCSPNSAVEVRHECHRRASTCRCQRCVRSQLRVALCARSREPVGLQARSSLGHAMPGTGRQFDPSEVEGRTGAGAASGVASSVIITSLRLAITQLLIQRKEIDVNRAVTM